MNTVKNLDYVLGHSQREMQRLIYQAAILRPVTERLLRNAKIGPGMRVLDLGCGAGDLSMLAAEFVGPTGLVVGIDRNREVLTLANDDFSSLLEEMKRFFQGCEGTVETAFTATGTKNGRSF